MCESLIGNDMTAAKLRAYYAFQKSRIRDKIGRRTEPEKMILKLNTRNFNSFFVPIII